jgi:hypothetical protein
MRTLSTARNTINLGSVATFHLRIFRYAPFLTLRRRRGGRIDFKGSQFERKIILWGVRWYVEYPIRIGR